MYQYSKTTISLGQTPKNSSKILFILDCFHGVSYCCVEHSNVRFTNLRSSKLNIESCLQKQLDRYGFVRGLHNVHYCELEVIIKI